MNTETLTFPKGGIYVNESKELTEKLPIETMPVPSELHILLNQHFGAPCSPLVPPKTMVMEGELIGIVEKGLGANIHSSVTGTVKRIGGSAHPVAVKAPAIMVTTDPDAKPKSYTTIDWQNLSGEEIVARIKDAGIVGLGGAGFPTHVKLSPPPTVKMDTLIVNGAECEPYLTTDHRVMLEYPHDIIEGVKIILTALGIRKCFIGIEENKPDGIATLRNILEKETDKTKDLFDIRIKPLQTKYPQGSEKQLIQSITGRKVPGFGLPFDVGVTVQNISTTKAIYEAVALEKPLYERIITISGRGIKRPANLRVRVGTRLSDIVDYLGR